jgi:Serine dehydrogenase proteinase
VGYAERLPIIKEIELLRKSKILCYLTSLREGAPGQMGDDAIRELIDQLQAIADWPSPKKLDLFLCSDGGDSVLPWRLVPIFRHFAESFAVLVPYHAYSAATILALGADEIVMHPFGVLGPIDPTVSNAFNPLVNGRLAGISVEDVKAYVNFVKQTVGITHEDELVQMLAILAKEVHPLALGNVERFLSQSRMIARKLLNTHMSGKSDRDIEDIVENLASRLFFHGHPINRTEAERDLQLKVAKNVPPAVEEAMWRLFIDFEGEFRNQEPFQPFIELAEKLQPWSVPLPPPSPGGPSPSPLPQLAHETIEVPLVIVESGTSSSVQRIRRRFTLISTYGQPDQTRAETLGFGWSRTPASGP